MTSAETTDTPPDPTPALLDVTAIEIVDHFNARSSIDEQQMTELVASVTESGVIQPIIVVKREPTKHDDTSVAFTLVAGHRRVEASKRAGRNSVPAVVYDKLDAASRMQLALVENLQREDINPIDEARGYQRAINDAKLTQAKLATLTGKPPSRISERLKLLKLPDECQQHIASGTIPLAAVKPLAQIAKTAPLIAAGCARLVATGEVEVAELVEQPHVVLSVLQEQEWTDAPFIHPIGWDGPVRFRGNVSEQELADLAERAASLGVNRFRFTSDDADAARSYGCLLEMEHQFGSHRFITDARFAHDRLKLFLDELHTQHAATTEPDAADEQNASTSAITSTTSTSTTTNTAAPSRTQELARRVEQEDKERVAKREAEKQQRLNAITANRQLGHNLVTKLGSKKVDRDTARLLAQIILNQNSSLAGRGIRYTHAEYHKLEQVRQKNQKVRTDFTVSDPHDAHTQLTEWVLRPTQPEEIIGRLLQALIAGTFADERAVAMSNRHGWYMGSLRTNIPALMVKHAKRLLPEHFHAQAERMLPTKPPAPAKTAKSGSPRAGAKPAKSTNPTKPATSKGRVKSSAA